MKFGSSCRGSVLLLAVVLTVAATVAACGASATPVSAPVGVAPTAIPPAGTTAPTSPPPTVIPSPTSVPQVATAVPTEPSVPTADTQPTPAATEAPATATPAPTPVPPTDTPVPETPTAEPQGPSLPATIIDSSGDKVVVEDISRIVVLNGDITEVVFALGLGDNVVAVDTSATYPPEARELPKVGYQRGLSAEGILSMEPTVIIGNTLAGPVEVIEQLRSTGSTVVIVEPAVTLAGAAAKIRNVAQALGVPEAGEEIASRLEMEIEEVKEIAASAQDKPSAVFLYMRGLDTLFMAGQFDLSHELFEASGAIGAAETLGVTDRFIPLTAEALAAANPDCIVVFTSGLETVGGHEGLLKVPGVAQTAAGQEGCILDFDGQYFAGGGPRMGSVLQELLAAFHPSLAPTS